MEENVKLAARMEELGFGQAELARRVNAEIQRLTGALGKMTDSDVRRLLKGRTRWPQAKQRLCLEKVLGASAVDLGFVPRRKPSPASPEDDLVKRRTFTRAATGTILAASPLITAGNRIGMSDVTRFGKAFNDLIEADNRAGGDSGTERKALGCAAELMALQQNSSSSQRVRSQIYFLAAAFTSTAMWAAVDARRADDAQRHLEKAVTLAGLSGDSKIQHRIWGHASMLAVQRKRYTDAIAAVEAAKSLSVSRRDPLFGSLAYARAAGIYSEAREPEVALRNLGAAERAFERVDFAEQRPSWMGFFDRAELEGLSALVRLDLGDFDVAESHLHRTLSLLRPDMLRNRAYYTAKLSFSQLGQGDVELATATMTSVPSVSPAAANSGRVRKLMDSFGQELGRVASGSSLHREWLDRNRKVFS